MTAAISSIGFVILVFAAIWLRFAWRGRMVGDQPCCQRCGYQTGAESSGEATCPECAWRGRMSVGFRRRSKRSILAAILLAIMGCFAACWPIIGPRVPTTSADVYAIIPDWLLVRMVDKGGFAAADEAADRVFEDELSSASERKLIDTLIELYADTTRQPDRAWSDALVLLFARGRMSPTQESAYIQATMESTLTIRSIVDREATTQAYRFLVSGRSPTTRVGGIPFSPRDVTVEAAMNDLRNRVIRSIQLEEVLVDRRPVEVAKLDGTSPWLPYGSGHQFNGELPIPVDAPVGGWTVSVRATIAVSVNGKELARWSVIDTADTRLAHPGETPIAVIRDPQERSGTLESLRAVRIVVHPVPDLNGPTIAVTQDTLATIVLGTLRPIQHLITGTIEIVTPDDSCIFGYTDSLMSSMPKSIVLFYPTPFSTTMSLGLRTSWQRGDPDGAVAFWSKLRTYEQVDIIFHSDPSAAYDNLQFDSVMDLSMIFRNVPVEAADTAPLIMHSHRPKPADLEGVPAEPLDAKAP